MFLSQLQFELNDFVIRDFKEIGQIDSPVYAEYGGEKSEYIFKIGIDGRHGL